MGGIIGAEEESVGIVQADTYDSVILWKREISQEVMIYADVAMVNIKSPFGKIDS